MDNAMARAERVPPVDPVAEQMLLGALLGITELGGLKLR